MNRIIPTLFAFLSLLAAAGPVQAGAPVPAPNAGVVGPLGLGIAVAAFAVFRIVRRGRS